MWIKEKKSKVKTHQKKKAVVPDSNKSDESDESNDGSIEQVFIILKNFFCVPKNINKMCQEYHKKILASFVFTALFQGTHAYIQKKTFMNHATMPW